MKGCRVNRRWLYTSPPGDRAVDASNYTMDECSIADPAEGEALVEAMFWSVDPYQRIQQSARDTWEAPHPFGAVQGGGMVGKVLASNLAGLSPGDFVSAYKGWQTHALVRAGEFKKIPADEAHRASAYLGVLGMPGRTAYVGIEILKPIAGQTLLVSGAAGAVGSIVLQLGKLHGARVVGIAGSADKCEYLTSIGADATVNYRGLEASALAAAIGAACPTGVDMYFDNVGGITTDAVLELMNVHGRIVICGQISTYNGGLDAPELAPRFLHLVLFKRLTIVGILARDSAARAEVISAHMATMLSAGQLTYRETVVDGFESLPSALNSLFTGKNVGKMVVRA